MESRQVRLSWLPVRDDWEAALRLGKLVAADRQVDLYRELATASMEFSQVLKLDRALQKALEVGGGGSAGLEAVRLAVLGSATTSHLIPGIRVGGLRHGLALDVYEAPYGMYRQELADRQSGLYAFAPEVVLLALDARHLAAADGSTAEAALGGMRICWEQAHEAFRCQVLQQTVLPVLAGLMGNQEHRLSDSPAAVVAEINERLRAEAGDAGVDLIAVDRFSAVEGIDVWHDPALWHRSKLEVHPLAAEAYGEQVARVIAAGRGRSAKCVVVDLDNTLWRGVIGDDGLDGIVLGQGSGDGEAFVEFQRYLKRLAGRGVILAVCSKNEEAVALEVFEKHAEMALKRSDIACFVANWGDKATNLRRIAKELNIGLDALVFVDDNPVERSLVRRELPMVRVPEMPDDPALFVQTLSSAGYFEALRVTDDDRARGETYKANVERGLMQESVTDMASYLESLHMNLSVQPFDRAALARVTQLINKTNQFNLTTERLCEAEVAARMDDARVVTLQARLTDCFGDNGVIAVMIARLQGSDAVIETWLMSCRVLGRRVEEGCLNVLVESCKAMGAKRLIGVYRPTAKNGMVRTLYEALGFEAIEGEGEVTRWGLEIRNFVPHDLPMQVVSAREQVVVGA